MRRLLVSALVVLFALLAVSSVSLAGKNMGGTANLSWKMNSRAADLNSVPKDMTVPLYIQLDGVVDVAGCEFELVWASADDSYQLASRDVPVDNGGCNWIMKLGPYEQLVMPLDEVTANSWKTAFASPRPSGCTAGNVAVAEFDISKGVPGRFCLLMVKVSDSYGQVDMLPVTGGAAILHGDGVAEICPAPAPYVRGVSPSQIHNTGAKKLAVRGIGFEDGCTVELHQGALYMLPTSVSYENHRVVHADFDFTGAQTGLWDVVVINPDAQSSMLVQSVTVMDPPPPAPAVNAVNPWYAFGEDVTNLSISGEHFYGTPSVLFQNRSGYTVSAGNIELTGNTISCTVDFSDQPLGDYTLVVANPDGQYDRLIKNAFSVKKKPLAANAFRVSAVENGFVVRWKIQNTADFNSVTIYRSSPGSEPVAIAAEPVKDEDWHSITDTGLTPGVTYDYQLLIGGDGVSDLWSDVKGVTCSKPIPARTALMQNTPNPFNPVTIIRYDLDRAQDVKLRVFDLTGRLVRTLTDQTMPAGNHAVSWNGTDDHGRSVASGLYFYRLETNDSVQVRKMVLLK